MKTLLLLVPALLSATEPRITNARLETRPGAGLENVFWSIVAAQQPPAWIGYSVASAGRSSGCCYGSNGACGCALETGGSTRSGAAASGPVRLEPSGDAVVLFRVEQQKTGKIRTFASECDLDAGGLPFIWLTGVRPAESLSLLASFAAGEEKLANAALTAVAVHADTGADALLDRWAAAGQPERLRRNAIFWLGASRGRHGYETLSRIVREDPAPRIREQAVFALSLSKEEAAIDTLLAAARSDASPEVRSKALFWIAQKAGTKAAGAIQAAISGDPDTGVKKQAVFALSRLDDGVPRLIDVARHNGNPEVKKQAFFWLGRSKDPRALDFFQEVLSRR